MIDEKLVSAHQWIVDLFQRQPAWWVEQTAWAFIAADIVAAALSWDSNWDIIIVLMTLGIGTSMIIASRNPALLASAATQAKPYRMMFLALLGYQLFILITTPVIDRLAHLLGTFLLTSCHYFAACQPPRPRKRRQVIAQGGAA
jgi:hypothetical protein